MKGSSCAWPAAKGSDQHHSNQRDPNFGSQIHKLKDAPPYDSIHVTSRGIEAIRSESQNFGAVDSWRAPESEYASYGEKDVRAAYRPCDPEYTRDSSSTKVYEEDINSEAEGFIETERKRLKLLKWMSTNSINY